MDKPLKQSVDELLIKRDFAALMDFCERDRHAWQEVRYSLYSLDERLRWSAVEAVAKLMEVWWKSGRQEKVRQYVRTLFWSMNDESGGIGWSSPQAVAEIIATIPEVVEPYGSMMIAHTIDEPPLVNGCLWGIGRMGRLIADSVAFFQGQILSTFEIDDAQTLGLASWATGESGFSPAKPHLERISFRTEPVTIYMDGEFTVRTLHDWAGQALMKIWQHADLKQKS